MIEEFSCEAEILKSNWNHGSEEFDMSNNKKKYSGKLITTDLVKQKTDSELEDKSLKKYLTKKKKKEEMRKTKKIMG